MSQNHEPAQRAERRPEGVHERMSLLESQETLAEAVRALALGLEKIPVQDTYAAEDAARGARTAHELLLSKRL